MYGRRRIGDLDQHVQTKVNSTAQNDYISDSSENGIDASGSVAPRSSLATAAKFSPKRRGLDFLFYVSILFFAFLMLMMNFSQFRPSPNKENSDTEMEHSWETSDSKQLGDWAGGGGGGGGEVGCDAACSWDRVWLAPRPGPLTALASFPGSGNTWARHLLQRLSGGRATCAVYCDPALRPAFPAECRLDARRQDHIDKYKGCLAVKTHYPRIDDHNLIDWQYDRTVLIVRNPAEAFVAYENYIVTESHTGHAPVWHFGTWEFYNRLGDHCSSWVAFHRYWLHAFQKPVFPVIYEDLKHGNYSVRGQLLRALGDFLGIGAGRLRPECADADRCGGHGRYRRPIKEHQERYQINKDTHALEILQSRGCLTLWQRLASKFSSLGADQNTTTTFINATYSSSNTMIMQQQQQ